MFIRIKNQQGEIFDLNIALIEAIYEMRNGGSEIVMTTRRRYTTLESLEKLSDRISLIEGLSKV